MNQTLVIPFSKNKLIGMILFSLLVLTLGVMRFVYFDPFSFLGSNDMFSKLFSYTAIGLGGLLLVIFLKQFRDDKPGLILDPNGITYNPKTNGFVKWTDIVGLTDYSVNGSHLLQFHLKNPDEFIASQTDVRTKRRMKFNLKTHNAPIAIGTHILDISNNKLKEEINRYLFTYGNNRQ